MDSLNTSSIQQPNSGGTIKKESNHRSVLTVTFNLPAAKTLYCILGWSLFLKVKNIEFLPSQAVPLNGEKKNMSPFEEVCRFRTFFVFTFNPCEHRET